MINQTVKIVSFIAAVSVTLVGCKNIEQQKKQDPAPKPHQIWVSPHTATCESNAGQRCLQTLDLQHDNTWQTVVPEITDFSFVSGHFYLLTMINERAKSENQIPDQFIANAIETIQYTSRVLFDNSKLINSRQWQLTKLGELNVINDEMTPYVTISKHGIHGFLGCNQFFSDNVVLFEAEKRQQSQLKITGFAMTRKKCHPANSTLEHQLQKRLKQANQLIVDWPQLKLYDKNLLIATFVAHD